MNRSLLILFRAALAVALIVISYLAFTWVVYPALDSIWDKYRHIAAFTVLSLLLDFSLPRTPFGWRKAAILIGYGAGIEIVQYFLPWREASGLDLLADCIGISIYVVLTPVFLRLPLLRERRTMMAG